MPAIRTRRPPPSPARASRVLVRVSVAGAALVLAGLAACAGEASRGDDARGATAAPALGGVESLASPAAPGSAEPNLAVGPDGHVYLSWLEPAADSTHALRFASLGPDDSRWSAAGTVVARGDLFVNWADFPSVRPLGGGELAAHWLQRGASRGAYDVRLARSHDGGGTWSESVVPHGDGTATEHGFVSLWPAAGDSVGVLWLDGRSYARDAAAGAATAPGHGHGAPGGEMALAYAMLAADGSVTAERMLDLRTCDCCQTSAAMTARGPLVVYRDRSPAEVRDIAAVRLVDGQWTAPALVHADGWTTAACPVNGPALSAEGERAAVAWFTAAGDTARVRLAFSDDAGATWSAPTAIDEGQPVGRVDATLLADGSALVLWLERTGGEGAALRLRRVRRDGTAEAPLTVAESAAARSSGFPQLVRSGGWAYLAWTAPGTPAVVQTARVALHGAGT